MNNRVLDAAWQIDYGRLHKFECGEPTTIAASEINSVRK